MRLNSPSTLNKTLSSPDSKSHRLCFFPLAPEAQKHVAVPHFVADEVEELREFIKFLYPPRGQDRFRLHRPDLFEMRWTVSAREDDGIHRFYTGGDTPRLAILSARHRLASEDARERTLTLSSPST